MNTLTLDSVHSAMGLTFLGFWLGQVFKKFKFAFALELEFSQSSNSTLENNREKVRNLLISRFTGVWKFDF